METTFVPNPDATARTSMLMEMLVRADEKRMADDPDAQFSSLYPEYRSTNIEDGSTTHLRTGVGPNLLAPEAVENARSRRA